MALKFRRLILLTVALLLMSLVLTVGVGATEDAKANSALAIEKHSDLLMLQDQYYALGDVGKSANEYVNQYSKYFNTLNDFVLSQDGASVLINLYHEQGITAGRLAFIYFTYTTDTRIADADRETLSGAHDALQAQIYSAKTAEEISRVAELLYADKGIYARMYVEIYDRMLSALLVEGDSDEVIRKVAVAREDIKKCTVVTASEQYEEIYARALADVKVQRNRDNAVNEIKKVFSILRPNDSIETSSAILAEIEYISRDSTTDAVEMNKHLLSALEPLVNEKKNGGRYVDGYADKLIGLIKLAVAEADGQGKTATVSPIFENFALELKKAEAKDAIATDIEKREYASDEKMVSLEAYYNADGGIIDECTSEDALLFEIGRAKLRAELYGELLNAKAKILSFGDFDSIVEEATKKLSYYDYNILSKDRTKESAADDCRLEYDAFVEELETLVISAETTAYQTKHADILGKVLSAIELSDAEALILAINDINGLSEGSLAVLTENGTVDKLAEKYKELAKKRIDSLLGEDKRSYSYELKDQVGKLSASSDAKKLSALVDSADQITEKAAAVKETLELLDSIKATEDYKSFSDKNKSELDRIATEASEAIVKAAGAAEAASLKADAAIELRRAEAYARLDAALEKNKEANAETYAKISELASDAKARIGLLSDPGDIAALTNDTVFLIDSEVIKEEMSKSAAAVDKSVDALGFVSDSEKTSYKERTDKLLADQKRAVDSSKDKAVRDGEIARFEEELEKIKAEAVARDAAIKTEKLSSANAALDERLAQCNGRIDVLRFLSNEEKEDLSTRAKAINITAGQELIAAGDSDSFDKILEKALADIDGIAYKAEEYDEADGNNARSELDAEIKKVHDALVNKLGTLNYVSDSVKNDMRTSAGEIYKEFSAALLDAKDRSELAELKSDAKGKLDELSEEADARQLEGAMLSATESIEERAKLTKKRIVGLKHLSADEKSRLAGEVDEEVANAISHVGIAPDVATVKAIESSVIASIIAIENEAKRLEDEAFVKALMPLIITLACIGVIEIIALAIVLVYKKKMLLAVAMPTVSHMLALTPLGAQVIAITLAIIDLALAVYIGYLIVIIYNARKHEEDESEDDAVFEQLMVEDESEFEVEIVELPESEPECENENDPEIEIEIVEIPDDEEQLTIPEAVESITVEEAEAMMTDEEAIELEQLEIDLSPELREVYHGSKKAEANIDTISACFSAGDRVSLNSLKEKGLVSRQAGSVKILARGRLDKPLTVVAQKFSVAAVKMILLTGGSVIIAEPAPERDKR